MDKRTADPTQPQGSFDPSASAAATIPEGQVLVLNVLVEGHFFSRVKLPIEDFVDVLVLKKLIFEGGKSYVFRGVDPEELVLLKVSMSQGQCQRGSLHTLTGQC
jgi:hypothetical protein